MGSLGIEGIESIETELRRELINHEKTREKLAKSIEKIRTLKKEIKRKKKLISELNEDRELGVYDTIKDEGVKATNNIKERRVIPMRVLIIEPGKAPLVTEIDNDLKSLQEIVEGNIEVVYLEANLLIVCNEEGKCLGLAGNRCIDNGDLIAGTFLICGGNYEGEMVSLTDEQIAKYNERFKEPEYYTSEEVENAIFVEIYDLEDEDVMEV